MDALISRANAIGSAVNHRKSKRGRTSTGPPSQGSQPTSEQPSSATLVSIQDSTSLPRSLRPSSPAPKGVKKHGHIADRRLRLELDRREERTARAQALREDAALLTEAVGADAGRIEVESEMERTWRLTQNEIVREVGVEAARQQREYKLDGGPYRCRYTRNGRHLAIVGKLGHVASFDWQTGTMHAELQLRETCRDIT